MKRQVSSVVGVLLLVAAGSACTTARAAKPVERPALEVPPPPPRVIAPLPIPELLPPIPEVAELPTNNKPESPRTRASREKPEPTKQDPKPETPPTEPPAPPPPATPVLRIPESADTTRLQNQIRASIGTARAILEKTDYGPLKAPLKKAYDEAKLFAKEAEDALNQKNLVYAKELADKAERLAKELQNR